MRASTVARLSALLCTAACVALLVTDGPEAPIVVGPVVPRPSWLAVALALCGCAAGLAGFVLGWPPEDAPPRSWPRTGLAALVSAVRALVCLVGVAAAFGVVVVDSFHTYALLGPASPGGCRVLLDQQDYGGGYWVVPPAAVVARATTVDSSRRLVPDGTATVTWADDVATVTLTDGYGSEPEVRQVPCPGR